MKMEEASIVGDLQGGLQLVLSDFQTKEFQCPICGKYFSRKFTLDAHMLIHKGEKPHMCQFCGKSFRQKGTLMRHKALHSSKNLFHCSLCNRGFRQKNVFIHHLRHRHNVSTETLDRRKYRTEPKDYQSIMDTLPPFVHADSTAIASSGKHFDALLSKSIPQIADDPPESSLQISIGGNVINSTIKKNALNNTDKLNSSAFHNSEFVIDEDYLLDIKPVFNNNICEINPSVSIVSSIVSDASHIDPNVLVASPVNSFNSSSNNVTSSNDIDDESIICLPCHRSFSNESEFKCHMKTHVQSVLLGDVNSSAPLISSASTTLLNSVSSDVSSVVSDSSDKSFKNQGDNYNSLSTNTVPVKIETSVCCLSPKNTNIMPIKPSSSCSGEKLSKSYKCFCPVCKIFVLGVDNYEKHAKQHDPCLLLKLYSNALAAKNRPIDNQNPVTRVNSANTPLEHKCRKNVIKSILNRNKCSKTFQCTQCQKGFSNKTLYEYHCQLHLSSKGFSCGCCKKNFSSKRLLLSHTRSNHFKTFSCPKCSRIFNYRKLFDLHKRNCIQNYNLKATNGSQINFPIVCIDSLLSSDTEGIVGIIPVCNSVNGTGKNVPKLGIPVLSVTQIKALYKSTESDFKM